MKGTGARFCHLARTHARLLALAGLVCISPIPCYSATTQSIGSLPEISGGFEDQPTGAVSVASSIASGTSSALWTVQTSSGTAKAWGNGGRSGPKYITFGASSARRLQSPTTAYGAVQNNESFVLQFYYRTPDATAAHFGQAAVSSDGTTGLTTLFSLSLPATTGTWQKVTQVITSGATSPKYGLACIRFSSSSGTDVDFDDLVLYPGAAADNTPPDPVQGAAVGNTGSGQLTLSWSAPASGVDGGGYVIVRGTNDPAIPPNRNGIYAVGNAVAAESPAASNGVVVYIGTNSTFTDNGLTDGIRFFYRLYAVDKAFNYSAPVTLDAVPGSCLSPESVAISADPGTNLCAGITVTLRATVTGGMTPYQYEWQRNGVPAGSSASSLVLADPADGDHLVCNVRSACGGSPGSATVSFSVRPILAPVVTVTASPGTNICPGQLLTLTATTTNAGLNPIFEWRRNGGVVFSGATGTNVSLLSITNAADLDSFQCSLVASETCASPQSAVSPLLTIHIRPLVTPGVGLVVAPGTNFCAGDSVVFTSVATNAGLWPVFQWMVNGAEISGATNSGLTLTNPPSGTVVNCRVTPSAEVCSSTPSAVTGSATVYQKPILTTSLTIQASPGVALCEGQGLTLTALAQNGGPAPVFEWRKNGGIYGGSSAICTDPSPGDGDRYECRLTSSADCAFPVLVDAGPLIVAVHGFSVPGARTVVYSENFGAPGAATSISNYSGWQAGAPVVYSSTTATDVRETSASTGYPMASGQGNVFMGSAGSGYRDFVVTGIDTRGYAALQLEFGLRIDSILGPALLEASPDGMNWSALIFEPPMTLGSWNWLTATGDIPVTPNLCLRFSKDNNAQLRIDDLRLTGLKMTPGPAQITASGPTVIRPGESVILTASPGERWLWSTGETNRSVTVHPEAAMTYTVAVTDRRGCSGAAAITLTVSTAPWLIGSPVLDPITRDLVARFRTEPNRSCTIENADAPNGPWSLLGMQSADAAGILELRVSTVGLGRKFYRAK